MNGLRLIEGTKLKARQSSRSKFRKIPISTYKEMALYK